MNNKIIILFKLLFYKIKVKEEITMKKIYEFFY